MSNHKKLSNRTKLCLGVVVLISLILEIPQKIRLENSVVRFIHDMSYIFSILVVDREFFTKFPGNSIMGPFISLANIYQNSTFFGQNSIPEESNSNLHLVPIAPENQLEFNFWRIDN